MICQLFIFCLDMSTTERRIKKSLFVNVLNEKFLEIWMFIDQHS